MLSSTVKKLTYFVLFTALLFSAIAEPAFVSAAVPTVSNDKTVDGAAANFVVLSGDYYPRVITAGNTVTQDVNVSELISAAGGAKAIVTGTYFNAYYDAKKPLSFPSNAPVTYGMILSDGNILHMGYNSTLAYTTGGKWIVGNASVSVKANLTNAGGDNVRNVTISAVNSIEDWGGVGLITDKLGMAANIPNDWTAFFIENGVITRQASGNVPVPAGCMLLYFSAVEYANHGDWRLLPEIGDKVSISYSFPEFGSDSENIVTALSCGPLILQNGKDVTKDPQINGNFLDAKNTGKAQRTFAGVTPDNKLIIGTASASFSDVAKTLLQMGCTDAIALDGGASSFLYANGKTLQNAGRKLNNVIAFYEKTDGSTGNNKSVQTLTAVPSQSKVIVNGKSVAFDAYNISGSNYFMLRDIAYALTGSEKQFEVSWDGAKNVISLISGQPYTVVGGEMAKKGSGSKTPMASSSTILLDGKEMVFEAYNIDGSNYFKLRDIGQAFDFGVGWDGANNTIVIDTSKRYMAD